jgi:hypothetical protein
MVRHNPDKCPHCGESIVIVRKKTTFKIKETDLKRLNEIADASGITMT